MMIDPHVIRSRREGSPYRPATGRDSDVTDIYMPARCFDGNQALVITERRRLVRPAPNSWPRPKLSPFFWLFFGGREYCYAIAMQLCKAIFRWLCVAEHVCFRCPLPLVPSAMC